MPKLSQVKSQGNGLLEAGNIDLNNRPRVRNPDGSISTVRSMSAKFDGREVLIPTVSDDGRILSDQEAINQFRTTGRHLGMFDTPDNATRYAEQLHRDQERQYAPQGMKLSQVRQAHRANFSDVSATVDSTERDANERTLGDRYNSILAGVGKSLYDTGAGVLQRGTEAVGRSARNSALLLDRAGFDGAGRAVAQTVGAPVERAIAAQQQATADRREFDPSFSEDPEYAMGNFAGVLGQLLGPGLALRGTTIGAGLLPTTIAGNTAQGVALGALQPSVSSRETMGNSALGALGGFGGSLVPKAATGFLGALQRSFGGQTTTGAERAAASAIRELSPNPGALMRTSPSGVPGVNRTLAEETTDPGVIALTRVRRGRNPGAFATQDADNNAARMQILQGLAGSESDMQAAIAARAVAGGQARNEAMQAGPVDVSQTLQVLDDAIAGQQGRPEIQNALLSVRNLLARDVEGAPGLTTTIPEDRIGVLDNVRLTMGDMLAGKWSQDTNKALSGSRELIGVRDALNADVGAQVPAFTDYLNAYRNMSGPINQMEVGRELIDASTAASPADVVGTPLLQAARFNNAFGDLNGVAARATGFNKANAEQILGPQNMANLGAINDDMTRIAIANRSPQVGSQTDANKFIGDLAADAVINEAMKDIPLARVFAKRSADQMMDRLDFLLTNPDEYRRVVAALPTKQREMLNRALLQLSARPAAATPALAE